MPTDTNKLLMQWQGPFEVVQKEGHLDYKINMSGKVKTFYGNLLEMLFSGGMTPMTSLMPHVFL